MCSCATRSCALPDASPAHASAGTATVQPPRARPGAILPGVAGGPMPGMVEPQHGRVACAVMAGAGGVGDEACAQRAPGDAAARVGSRLPPPPPGRPCARGVRGAATQELAPPAPAGLHACAHGSAGASGGCTAPRASTPHWPPPLATSPPLGPPMVTPAGHRRWPPHRRWARHWSPPLATTSGLHTTPHLDTPRWPPPLAATPPLAPGPVPSPVLGSCPDAGAARHGIGRRDNQMPRRPTRPARRPPAAARFERNAARRVPRPQGSAGWTEASARACRSVASRRTTTQQLTARPCWTCCGGRLGGRGRGKR